MKGLLEERRNFEISPYASVIFFSVRLVSLSFCRFSPISREKYHLLHGCRHGEWKQYNASWLLKYFLLYSHLFWLMDRLSHDALLGVYQHQNDCQASIWEAIMPAKPEKVLSHTKKEQ